MLSLLRLNLIKLKYNYLTNAKKKYKKKPVRNELLNQKEGLVILNMSVLFDKYYLYAQ